MNYFDINSSPESLTQFLKQKDWLRADEHITQLSIPGEGNMNVVLRLLTNQRSLILKQSRPFVQKYQDLAAPLDRVEVEYQFYKATKVAKSKVSTPTILHYDATEHLLLMEDLGQCEDLTSLYQSRVITEQTVLDLIHFLESVHQTPPPVAFPTNMELRKLNHQHIFILPFLVDNGFDLDNVQQGLQDLSAPYKNDKKLQEKTTLLGKQYLSAGNTLLHGDFYPGSWMQAQQDLYVIDPEFSFVGNPAFDLGVMTAHLIIATLDSKWLDFVIEHYNLAVDNQSLQELTGIEIMRRLIGLAQLPLRHSLAEKEALLKLAYQLIMTK